MRIDLKLITAVIGIYVLSAAVLAQSTNSSSPTPINGEYAGKGPSKETNYYFSFTGGPGNVKVQLDIKAKDYSTFARIEIGNNPANLIAMANMNASTTTGPASVTKEFTLEDQQTVRIKLTLDGNLAEYKLSINGGGGASGGMIGGAKTGSGAKLGKVGSKIGSIGSAGKPKVGTQGTTGTGPKDLSFTCPKEITYQIVPIADWNPTLYSIKRLTFDNASIDSGKLFCTYSSTSPGNGDSSTLMKAVPAGYTCSIYNSGGKNGIFTCTTGVTATLGKQEEVELRGRR